MSDYSGEDARKNTFIAEIVDSAQKYLDLETRADNFDERLNKFVQTRGTLAHLGAGVIRHSIGLVFNAYVGVKGASFETKLRRYGGSTLADHAYEATNLETESTTETRRQLAGFVISRFGYGEGERT
jgi:hypothetical protein